MHHRCRIMKTLTPFLFAFASLLFPGLSQADEDLGEIALIEDVGSLILPAEGMCPNMLFGQGLCVNEAAKAFYRTHPDEYDILIFYTTKVLGGLFNVCMGFPVQMNHEGIGLDTSVPSLWGPDDFGSAGRLIQCVKMGDINAQPENPSSPTFPPISGVELMAHEIGHQWLVWLMIDLDDGRGPMDILRGYEDDSPNGHYSSWFNSGSVMYGGLLVDNGDGTFTDANGPRRYSQLDQYLMGLRPAADMDPMWYVDVDGTTHGSPSMPGRPGIPFTYSGTRVDFTIDDVIRANGKRNPELEPCHMKVGIGLVYPEGVPPTPQQIAKVDLYRRALEEWWPAGTDQLGSLDTTLLGCGGGTDTCKGQISDRCLAAVCEENMVRCSGMSVVQVCHGGEWEFSEECVRPMICGDGTCVQGPVDGDLDADHSEEENPDPDSDPVSEDREGSAEDPEKGELQPEDSTETDALPGDQETPDPEACVPQSTRCYLGVYQQCGNSEVWLPVEDCRVAEKECDENSGCVSSKASGGCRSSSEILPAFLLLIFAFLTILRRSVIPRIL